VGVWAKHRAVTRAITIAGREELRRRRRGSDRTAVDVADDAVIQLMTRCASVDEFIERFARFTTETDVIVPAVPDVSVGTKGHFVIRLSDRSEVMKGQCEVTEIRPVNVAGGAAGAAGRTLMRLRLREMDAHSCGIHLRLMERHGTAAKPAPAPPPAPARVTRTLTLVPPLPAVTPPPVPVSPPLPAARSLPLPGLVAMPAAAPAAQAGGAVVVAASRPEQQTEPTEVSPPRHEARVPGAAFTLPANPLSELDAADLAGFVEGTLLETSGRIVTTAAPPRLQPRTGRTASAPRMLRRGLPYAACAIGGLLLGIAFRPDAKVAVMVGAPSVVAPVPEAPAPSIAPPATEGHAPPPSRDCVARVTTTPAGAAVLWGDVALGPSPITHATVPCGASTVTFRRERYAEATRTLNVEPGREAVVAERLYRPPAKLVVTSSPAHARIKVNRRRFGEAPRKISTMRFEHVRIEASLPGYRPWRKTVYLSEAESRVDVTLVRAQPPNGRPSRSADHAH
jgi:hypothetical protein